jgi:carbohydrate esterase-like sialic acid-specific acetylesterase
VRAAALLAAAFFFGGLTGALVYRQMRSPLDAPPASVASARIPARVVIPKEHLGSLHIFLLAGQSNMSGRGALPEARSTAAPGVCVFGGDYRWHEGREPVDFAEGQVDEVSADPGAGFGPSIAFAEALRGIRPDLVIGLVPCARGGSTIHEWQRDLDEGTLYGSCLKRARAAEGAGRIAGALFFQGEADAGHEHDSGGRPLSPDRWAAAFEAMVKGLRGDLGTSDLPVVFAELGKAPRTNQFPGWERVKAEQRRVHLPHAARITTDDLALADPLHFTTESYRVIGQRFATAMAVLLTSP